MRILKFVHLFMVCFAITNYYSDVLSKKPKEIQKPQTRRAKKIIGYMQVHNAENIVEQSVRCLLPHVNAIVILDDASTDETASILRELQKELPNLTVIFNQTPSGLPGRSVANQETLLSAARKLKGTHFIAINADEIISSNCLVDNFLRTEILKLKPGEKLELPLIHMWGSAHEYKSAVKGQDRFTSIFCDVRKSSYKKNDGVSSRLPSPLKGKVHSLPSQFVVLQYSCADLDNTLIEGAWCQCLELIQGRESVDSINRNYRINIEEEMALDIIDPQWIVHYPQFDSDVYSLPNYACEQEIYDLFNKHGKEFFKDLNIWQIDWEFDS